MSTIPLFHNLLLTNASNARYYRISNTGVPCPCRTPEGFRDPEFHLAFGRYGPGQQTLVPGSLPANHHPIYSFIGKDVDGTAIAPAIPAAGISSSSAFGINFEITWPQDGRIQEFQVMRSDDNGATYAQAVVIPFPIAGWVDPGPIKAPGAQLVLPSICNEAGEIPGNAVDVMVKAFVQPIQSTRATRLSTEYLQEVFGNIEADDHLGIFPVEWAGTTLSFDEWSQSGEDFIEYDGLRFFVVNSNMIPDPGDGNPRHHYELGLRLIRSDGLGG